MMCFQSIGRPSCYFSAWGAGSGQASYRCSALCTCKQACRGLNFLLLSHQVLTCGRFWLRLSCVPQHHSATCTSPCTCTCTPTCSNVFCRYFPCTQRVPSSVYALAPVPTGIFLVLRVCTLYFLELNEAFLFILSICTRNLSYVGTFSVFKVYTCTRTCMCPCTCPCTCTGART